MNEERTPESSAEAASDGERRGHRRFEVEGIEGRFLLSTNAKVVNLSLDGLALETASPLKVGWEYSLSLHDGGERIAISGKVVWCNLVATRPQRGGDVAPVYRAGIHFEDLLDERAAAVRNFLETNAVVSLEQRLFGRFRIEPGRAASVDCEATFKVEELSLTGMLIETALGPRIDAVHLMEIQFPEMSFSTRARIVRSDEIERRGSGKEDAEGARRYRVGVKFLQLDEAAQTTLAAYLEGQPG